MRWFILMILMKLEVKLNYFSFFFLVVEKRFIRNVIY